MRDTIEFASQMTGSNMQDSPIARDDFSIHKSSAVANPAISVIVPIYNMQSKGYLQPCIESLLHQSLPDFEAILVDDASTDDSLSAALSLVSKDDRFTVLELAENGKQGTARNRGVTMARAPFLLFLDADDALEERCLEELLRVQKATDADVIECAEQRIDADGNAVGDPSLRTPASATGVLDHEKRRALVLNHCKAIGCLLRTSMIKESPYSRFPEGIFFEDTPVAMDYLFAASRVERAENAIYKYRRHSGSTVMTFGKVSSSISDRNTSLDILLKNAHERGVYGEFKDEFDYFYVHAAAINLFTVLMRNPESLKHIDCAAIARNVKKTVPDYYSNRYYRALPLKTRIARRLALTFPELYCRLLGMKARA